MRVHFLAQSALADSPFRLVLPLLFNPADSLPFLFPFLVFVVFLQPLPGRTVVSVWVRALYA
jgi:hypothetical protein